MAFILFAVDLDDAGVRRSRWLGPAIAAAAVVSYLALGYWVMHGLWVNPSVRILQGNQGDHALFLFLLAHGERVVYDGASLLHSTRLNAPVGVNMMANTSVFALSLPLAPVTHYFGPGVTVALLLTLGLGCTAAAWYWFLRRNLGLGRTAAYIGGLWGGFAPGWLSHASSHVNFVCSFVLPFILDQILRLREPGRVWRGGITLALLIVVQVFINEETLLIMAISLVFFVIAYAAMDWRTVRECAARFSAGLGVAVVVSGAMLGYFLYYQFLGPGHYHGQPFVLDRFATSLGSIVTLPRESVFGSFATAAKYSTAATEDTVFWGPAACVMIIVSIVVLWRFVAARAAAIAALILLIMSFGSHFRVTGVPGGLASPLGWTMNVPLLEDVTTPRYALAPTAIAGILLAVAADRAFRQRRRTQILFAGGLALALVPLFPRPVPTFNAPPVPAFFSEKMWRPYVMDGTKRRNVVIVPLPNRTTGRDAMRLAALTNSAFGMPTGYFMGPKHPPQDTTGAWSSPQLFTSHLINTVTANGVVPPTTDVTRAKFARDLRYWKAGVVVLLPNAPHWEAEVLLLSQALGTPATQGGVLVWDVRSLYPASGSSSTTG